ncbi:tRNA lysidine(34) synthetase TilS [Elizabethkingia argentiflava]|uniref:tRNA(Ile)-lysidine synthase n=1 Tax=Elizabethkingia argenteiflava TaxID=2681556 RepID=A0A845PXR5_9FLAO|nr:tRNA lysidine(34) synthetase TilS [Elizabethkingia argenteiflava]NAW51267.1 tRNA lysidine(34) synthetase TilS [Elizabethkingia argenteiflava]
MIELTSFKKHLQHLCNRLEKHKFLLAVSGGADSMVLSYLFLEAHIPFEIAHVNYHLRGEDSNLDQWLVEDFCRQHSIEFHLYKVSDRDNKPKNSIELWARKIRYRFFFEILEKQKLDYIVTAHHLNDQLETFLINLSKASGINGLSGIPENSNQILRPLLHNTKYEIYDFARQKKLCFREDHTNQSKDYLRNQIRHDITPELEKINPSFWSNFDRSLSHLKQAKAFIEEQLDRIIKEITLTQTPNEIVLDKEKLADQPEFVRYEILKKYEFTNPKEQQKIFSAHSGSQFKNTKWHLFIYRNELTITTAEKITSEITSEIILNLNEQISFPQPLLLCEQKPTHQKYWELDPEKIAFPLKLRKAKVGDFFYPQGMTGKKSISKFFKDEKMSILARRKTWLLADSKEQVIGIINHRQDRRFLPKTNHPKIYLYL